MTFTQTILYVSCIMMLFGVFLMFTDKGSGLSGGKLNQRNYKMALIALCIAIACTAWVSYTLISHK